MMNFSKNLRELRAKHGLTQEVLADKIGVSRQMIARYESGENYPEMDKAVLIAQVLNCKLDDLVNSKEPVESFGPHLTAQTVSVKLEKPKLSVRDKVIYISLWCAVSLMVFGSLIASAGIMFGEQASSAAGSFFGALMIASWCIIAIIYKAK
ncbi:MAG: helix-turn-helix domain-containing protein [Candidatus Nomurabacteria bacterium]|nr:helix-turn-helix domain-containing protein [Candidatus Nomurabacteria bacterium]